MGPWDEIKADREALADYLEGLSADEWNQPSLCDGWTVKGVATHLLVTPTMSKGQVFIGFARAGFNLDKFSARLVDQMTASMSNDEVVAVTRETAGSQSAPPGLKPLGILGEVLIHANDISDALGKPLELPVEHYVTCLEHTKDVQPVLGSRKRIAGLTLRATDANWSTGSGPLVEGDARHLLSAMTGRRESLGALSGDGVETLRSR